MASLVGLRPRIRRRFLRELIKTVFTGEALTRFLVGEFVEYTWS